MRSIVICEKATQAANIKAAVAGQYGQVYPCSGHIVEVEEPADVKEEWAKWSYDLLLPPGGRFKLAGAPDARCNKLLTEIGRALKTADEVYIATDCDREGQLIGDEVLRWFNYKGSVKRAMFPGEDKKTLQKAFAEARNNQDYFNLSESAEARRQADKIFALSLTRAATLSFKPAGQIGSIGIGRVKTPTLAIVASREQEILDFVSQKYFDIKSEVSLPGARQLRLSYSPKEEWRLPDEGLVNRVIEEVRGHKYPVRVTADHKKKGPPDLMDLSRLQQKAGAWGWSAKKVLEIAQALYDTHKIATYPRAETTYLPEANIDFVQKVLQGLAGIPDYHSLIPDNPEIRTGKSGNYSDKALAYAGASHHATVPNPATWETYAKIWPALSDDERRLFDLMARHFIAAHMPDYEYLLTTASQKVPLSDSFLPETQDTGKAEILFKATGTQEKNPGWRHVIPATKKAEDLLPQLNHGEDGLVASLTPVSRKTEPPKRYTEGSLVTAMKEAWRFVFEEELRSRLKEAKGVGTPATRGGIIEDLKRGKLLQNSGKNIIPGEQGMALYRLLEKVAPELNDPAQTALMEISLDEVAVGKKNEDHAIREIAGKTQKFLTLFEEKAGGILLPEIKRSPTFGMKKFAEGMAKSKELALPEGYKRDYRICQAFIEAHKDQAREDGTYAPTDKQIGMATALAEEVGESIGEEDLYDRKKLAARIDDLIKRRPARPASAGQKNLVTKLAHEKKATPPEGWEEDSKLAGTFIDKYMSKSYSGKKRRQKKGGPGKR